MSAFTILDLDPDLGCGISLITQQTSQKSAAMLAATAALTASR